MNQKADEIQAGVAVSIDFTLPTLAWCEIAAAEGHHMVILTPHNAGTGEPRGCLVSKGFSRVVGRRGSRLSREAWRVRSADKLFDELQLKAVKLWTEGNVSTGLRA